MPATEQYMKLTGAYDQQIPKYSGAQGGDHLSSGSQVLYKLSALTSKGMLNVPNLYRAPIMNQNSNNLSPNPRQTNNAVAKEQIRKAFTSHYNP